MKYETGTITSTLLPNKAVIFKQNCNHLPDRFRKRCRKIIKVLRIKTHFQNMFLEGNSTFLLEPLYDINQTV